jgi:putative aldouronate transport system substrate-binding protein
MKMNIFSKSVLFCIMLFAIVMNISLAGCSTQKKETGTIHPMRFVVGDDMPPDYETGIKAVNEKIKADSLDIEVEVIYLPWDVYEQRLNLLLAAGDPFELIYTAPNVKDIGYFIGINAILAIDDMLSKYPNLRNFYSTDEWNMAKYNQKTYGVPAITQNMDNYLGPLVVLLNPLQKVASEFPTNGNIDEFIDVSKKMQEQILKDTGKKAYHWVQEVRTPPYWLHRSYPTYPFYVNAINNLILARQDGTIDSYFESQEFEWDAKNYRKLNQAGLIYPDALNFQSIQWSNEFTRLGVMLPSEANKFMAAWISLDTNLPGERVAGYFLNPEKPHVLLNTTAINAISATAERPESGLIFLDWLYSSKENHDLFHYGIEGVHYTATTPNKIAPVNNDAGNRLYWANDYMSGYFPWIRVSEQATLEQLSWHFYKAEKTVYTPIAGFFFDITPVASQLAALETEVKASFFPIRWGLVDYEASYPIALQRLKAAGLDQYMMEYRRQFSEYLKINPDIISR